MDKKKKKSGWLKSFLKDFTNDTSKSGKRNVLGPVIKKSAIAWKNLPANLRELKKERDAKK